jgi:TonB family protein
MNRLQKKCVIVTAGVHLLLLLILIVGPAFFSPKPKEDDLQVLDVIPANLIDAPFSQGVANAVAPPPAPVTPPPPVPAVMPPAPVPTKVEPPKSIIKEIEKVLTPTEKPKEEHKPQISTTLVTRNAPKVSPDASKANEAARARAIRKTLQKLKNNLTSGTVVDMPGSGSAAYASYKDALGSLYYNAWTPDGAGNDEANTYVRITVASDGTVINARIITPSGDEKMDDSVQRALQQVPSVPPLPDQSKIQQDFTIMFNLKAKRMLE